MTDLTAKTDKELQKLWNGLAACFEGQGAPKSSNGGSVGFLQLSRETERRGLEIGPGKLGEIVLVRKGAPAVVQAKVVRIREPRSFIGKK